jgi:FAD-dependent halogenase
MSSADDADLIVIGGGPAGTTLASLVAKQGHRVILLERAKFPRYQIGESTLPQTYGIFRHLGVLDELEAAGFNPKLGGRWYWGDSDVSEKKIDLDFTQLPDNLKLGKNWAYQVERVKFDEILLNHARRLGVDVREEHSVEAMLTTEDNDRVGGVRWESTAAATKGKKGELRARFVVDAAGHTSPHHRLCGDRVFADRFRNLAVFGYFTGGKRMPAPLTGSIMNVSFGRGWFWYIPLSAELTSVGAVLSLEHANILKQGHEPALKQLIAECPRIADFLSTANRVTDGVYGEVRVRKDWSYCNTKFYKPGLALVGDAACFVDPLFSSGIHLATYSALLAGRSINTLLASGNSISEDDCFIEFQLRYRDEYLKFYEFLTAFYQYGRTKADYFRRAHELIGTNATESDQLSFTRLVSGFAPNAAKELFPGAASPAPDDVHMMRGEEDGAGDVDGFHLGHGSLMADVPSPPGCKLVPSADGAHWRMKNG